eukprot:COSAG01_NODE_29636_length_633_cov_1.050562_2_plen_80_part_00
MAASIVQPENEYAGSQVGLHVEPEAWLAVQSRSTPPPVGAARASHGVYDVIALGVPLSQPQFLPPSFRQARTAASALAE